MSIQTKGTPPFYKKGIIVREWTVLLTQTSTNLPVIEAVLKNTMTANIGIERAGVGVYKVNCNGAGLFDAKKTWLSIQDTFNGSAGTYGRCSVYINNTNELYIITTNSSSGNADGILKDTPFQIKIYTTGYIQQS